MVAPPPAMGRGPMPDLCDPPRTWSHSGALYLSSRVAWLLSLIQNRSSVFQPVKAAGVAKSDSERDVT
jgi:hypothetical protein